MGGALFYLKNFFYGIQLLRIWSIYIGVCYERECFMYPIMCLVEFIYSFNLWNVISWYKIKQICVFLKNILLW